MKRILVTGGTGSLGREFVRAVSARGWGVRVMSRRPRPAGGLSEVEWAQADLRIGAGLREALDQVDAVLHAASSPVASDKVDVKGTRLLLEQARAARVRHFLYISIVGIDKIPFRYYRSKLAAEVLIQQAGLPWTILRTTQFHSLIDRFLSPLSRLPVMFLPTDFKFQSVAEGEVAKRLAEGVLAGPAGRLPDLGGPKVHSLGEMVALWLEARRLRRWIVRLPLPGQTARGFRRGDNTVPEGATGKISWKEWLLKSNGVPRTSNASG